MQWSPRLHPWRIKQLYQLTNIGILDEDKLMHVGWGLYARSESVLAFGKAMRGQVPCPECNHIVYRQIFYRQQQRNTQPSHSTFSCPTCAETVSWQLCRDALRNHPRCLDCYEKLDWNYTTNDLQCLACQKNWTWQTYRQSLKHRLRLPCPHCNQGVRKPAPQKPKSTDTKSPSTHWDLTCPKCKQQGHHIPGKFQCTACGHEKNWRKFTKSQKRKIEHLNCTSCGHTFTWQSWKKQYDSAFSHTGNPAPIRQFVDRWPKSKTPGEQLIAIDRLIHALHGRGALAPVFIKGDQKSVSQWLDDMAFK